MLKQTLCSFIIPSIVVLASPLDVSLAYIGPGTGVSAIGSLLALIAGIIVAIIGFVWYPIKRIMGKVKPEEPDQIEDNEE